jgi:hypothetical protein
MWFHYCDDNNHNIADFRSIAKFNVFFEAKSGSEKMNLGFLFEEIHALKRE